MADGRLAFFLTGKFGEDWKLAASADTREEPVKDLFTNFLDKSPESLFRRIDPDYTYPTFGDDGTVDEIAPTQGKFYVKLSKDESHALWGNFKARYLENELAQVDRGLYGANLRFQSQSETRFGEKRLALDGFAAEPGTVPSQEEFRGTGGSLYYLRRQDLLRGSERVRIEMRDKDSAARDGRGAPEADTGLRHRLSPGPRPAHRAPFGDRGRRPADSQPGLERRRGLAGRPVRVHARLRPDRRAGRRRTGPLLAQRFHRSWG